MQAREDRAAQPPSLSDTRWAAMAVFSQGMTFTPEKPCRYCSHWLMAWGWE